mgnify:CR=1 FL=1
MSFLDVLKILGPLEICKALTPFRPCNSLGPQWNYFHEGDAQHMSILKEIYDCTNPDEGE